MFFCLDIIQTEGPSILKYSEGIEKATIGIINADQQGTDKVTLCHLEKP